LSQLCHFYNMTQLQAIKWHLTYKDHQDKNGLLAHFRTKGEVTHWSIIHEVADESNPYEHTHALVHFKDRIRTRDCHCFDFNNVHCNMKIISSIAHWNNTWKYHEKEGGDLFRSEPRGGAAELLQSYIEAPTLVDALVLAGINPKSILDMTVLRREKRPRETEHQYDIDSWLIPPVVDFKCFFIHGTSDCGKTQWAKAHFKNPLVCRDTDDLKNFVPGHHDGIVFDDMSFAHWPRTSVIHLLDWDEDSSIRCRNTNALIPRHTPKIFCANTEEEDVFGPKETAKCRRITRRLKVTGKLYK